MDRISDFGRQLESAAQGIFDGPAVEDGNAMEIDIGITDPTQVPMPTGKGFNLSFMHYKDPTLHAKPYFFTSQLGSPFPSYHSNPQPKFPARWTLIPGVRPPCENLTAPRIRLAPQELVPKVDVFRKMRNVGHSESTQGDVKVLNLSHQCLGDEYQLYGLLAFLAINKEVEVLNLNDNELEDIIVLEEVVKKVRVLHLSHNNFVAFDSLPYFPNLERLYVNDNFFSGFDGLTSSRFPKLKYINIDLNPIQHKHGVTVTFKDRLPTLEVIYGAEH